MSERRLVRTIWRTFGIKGYWEAVLRTYELRDSHDKYHWTPSHRQAWALTSAWAAARAAAPTDAVTNRMGTARRRRPK
jgi:hypothetical protein